MKRLTLVFIFAWSLVGTGSFGVRPAHADDEVCTKELPVPGAVGVYPDPDGLEFVFYAAAFVPFNIYAVAFDLEGGLLGYELSFSMEGLTVLSWSNLGDTNLGDPPTEFIVSTGECLATSGAVALVQLRVGSFTGANLVETLICVAGSDPSSFPAFGNAPGYLRCDGTLRPFTPAANCPALFPNGCMILNPTYDWRWVCPLEDVSIGALKARF